MVEERTEKFLKDHGITTWGSFNNPPEPYVECDISEFWGQFHSYGVREEEFRQVYLNKKSVENVHILIYSDCIYMISVNWNYNKDTGTKYIPVCYKIGCDHNWDIQVNIRGFGKKVCKKCGYWEQYDCSD